MDVRKNVTITWYESDDLWTKKTWEWFDDNGMCVSIETQYYDADGWSMQDYKE